MKTKKIVILVLTLALILSVFTYPALAVHTYSVKPGDNLWDIAASFGTTPNKIATTNNLVNPNFIFPGQNLIIPDKDNLLTISIVHTNDIHARVEEGKYDGMGLDKVATIVNNTKANNPNTLVLDAGDTFHGQTIATLNKGESIVKIMNQIGYDVMTPGNHDFNYGQDRLLELSKLAQFDIISANVYKDDYATLLPSHVIKEVGGLKVAIFGLATPETVYKTHPNNVKGIIFFDPVIISKLMVKELENKSDIIICLSHLGLDESSKITSKLVAEKVDGIDVIVDGHSHTTLETGKIINNTLIVQAGEYAKNVGIVNLTVCNKVIMSKTAKLITKDEVSDLIPNKAVKEVIDKIKTDNKIITSEKIGETAIKLIGERINVRTSETNLGNLVADAMVSKTGADCALTNGGGIRSSIDVGDITVEDIITVFPFGNYIVTKKVTGEQILSALENGLSNYPDESGAFPHISGITVSFNPSKEVGNKVSKVLINGEEINPNKEYILATNDFIAAGGDQYAMFLNCKTLGEYPGLDEILIEYITENGTENSPVEGRIAPIKNTSIIGLKPAA